MIFLLNRRRDIRSENRNAPFRVDVRVVKVIDGKEYTVGVLEFTKYSKLVRQDITEAGYFWDRKKY